MLWPCDSALRLRSCFEGKMWHVVGHSPAEKESLAERTFRNCSKIMLTCSSVLDRGHMMASMYDLYVSIALYHMVYSQLAACSSGGSVLWASSRRAWRWLCLARACCHATGLWTQRVTPQTRLKSKLCALIQNDEVVPLQSAKKSSYIVLFQTALPIRERDLRPS